MKLTHSRIKLLKELEEEIFYEFKNIKILDRAFHHISKANEQDDNKYISNERMEFLGDSILGFVFSEYFYKKYDELDEGELTKLKSNAVCEESFSNAAKQFNLGKYLILGKGEEKSGGRNRESILSDTFEALFAAIYLDSSSYELVYELITKQHIDIFNKYLAISTTNNNYKAILQNYIQREYRSKIKYRLDKTEGPDHAKIFHVTAVYNNIILEEGTGRNKKIAEQEAAKKSIEKLGIKIE